VRWSNLLSVGVVAAKAGTKIHNNAARAIENTIFFTARGSLSKVQLE